MANWAAEIRIRAERKLGEMLKALKGDGGMAQGKRTDLVAPCDQVEVNPTLSDMGMTKSMSSRNRSFQDVLA